MTHEARKRGVQRVLLATLLLNALVSGAKIVVGTAIGSLAMVADGYHSLLDGSNNVIGLVVTRFAYAPPDPGHPYGHRKFETSAALLLGLGLLALAYSVFEGALASFQKPSLPEITPLSWAVMFGTLAVNFFVAWYEAREGRRLQSEYLLADAAHTRSDVYVTLGVVASFAGARAGVTWLDPLVATGIAAFIAWLAVGIVIRAFHVLTDRAAIEPGAIAEVVAKVPGVKRCGEVRTRGGDAVYVDLVALVDGGMPMREAHDVADRIEHALHAAFPAVVDVVVHLEPAD
ncbi:MAG: cation diffusion facilitator family transporter [Vicinamibacteria bacterium]|nr:cation diffusion facilitator family transporter [Vicinamibacteria bacterium]